MTYNFFLVGDLNRLRLAAAFASLTGTPLDQVDVSDIDEDPEDRNWHASVSCTYARVRGDVDWLLDVYLAEDVRERPTEATAASLVANVLGTAVLYAAPIALPSAYWLAGPDGLLTRARLYSAPDDADEGTAYRIDAVERPVPRLPSVPVASQPEVIREYRVPAPITSDLHSWLEHWQATHHVPAEVADLVWRARTRLAAWEHLTARMAAHWPPDGWYPTAYYAEDLRARDQLDELLAALPPATLPTFRIALDRIDENFQRLTVKDADDVLADRLGVDPGSDAWWWHRVPNPQPWPTPYRSVVD